MAGATDSGWLVPLVVDGRCHEAQAGTDKVSTRVAALCLSGWLPKATYTLSIACFELRWGM